MDAQGNAPFIVNPEEQTTQVLSVENRDPLHTNEIVIQFMAVSRFVLDMEIILLIYFKHVCWQA